MKKRDLELKARDEEKRVQNILRCAHKKPVTRRDFLSLGLIGTSAYVMAPSLLGLFTQRAEAAELNCSESASVASGMVPFFVIDLSGGAPLGQDFMVGGRGGQADLLVGANGSNGNAYDQFAISDTINYYNVTPNADLGVRFHPNSTFLTGLQNGMSTDLAAMAPSVDGAIMASAWGSDTSNNPGNPIHYLNVVGRNGILIPTVGTSTADSGGNSISAMGSIKAATKPVRVTSQGEATNILSGGNLVTLLGKAKAQQIRDAISTMSASKVDAFNNLATNDQITELVKCGYIKASALPNKFDSTTFFNDGNLNTAFGNANSTGAVISRLVFSGAVGAATIGLGGYDNHDNTATSMRAKNQEAGTLVGQILRYARLNNSPVFICVITDGSMGISALDANTGFFAHPGDNDSVTTLAMMSYVPGKVRGDLIQNDGRQVGSFTRSGVDRNYLITATNPTNAAQAMMYNYLALQGRESEITKINAAGTNPFAANPSAYLMFKKAV